MNNLEKKSSNIDKGETVYDCIIFFKNTALGIGQGYRNRAGGIGCAHNASKLRDSEQQRRDRNARDSVRKSE